MIKDGEVGYYHWRRVRRIMTGWEHETVIDAVLPNLPGAATFAFLPVTSNEVMVGWSFCSPRDQFNKRKGRLIAEGRMTKDPVFISIPPGEPRPTEYLVQETIDFLLKNNLAPRWFARLWAPIENR